MSAILAGVILGVGCCVVQPTGSSRPAGRHADPDRFRSEVRSLTLDFGPRFHDRTGNLKECRRFIREKFEACGAEVEEQSYSVKGRDHFNVRAFFGRQDQPRIVVGAHYDTCEGHGVNPGADDNASGVAGLFGLARLLKEERPPNVCIELVAYSTEEPPYFGTRHIGSYHHAARLAREGIQVRGVLILEMIGYFSDEPGSQQYPSSLFRLFYPSTGSFVAVVGGMGDRGLIADCKHAMKGSAPLMVCSTCLPRSMGSVHLSDHRNYWPFGFDAVMITDTSFFRNSNYHQPTDTWDTLDYPRMAHVVTQVHQAVLALGKKN